MGFRGPVVQIQHLLPQYLYLLPNFNYNSTTKQVRLNELKYYFFRLSAVVTLYCQWSNIQNIKQRSVSTWTTERWNHHSKSNLYVKANVWSVPLKMLSLKPNLMKAYPKSNCMKTDVWSVPATHYWKFMLIVIEGPVFNPTLLKTILLLWEQLNCTRCFYK